MLKLLLTICVAFASLQFSNFVEAKGGSCGSCVREPVPKEFSELTVSKGDIIIFPYIYGGDKWRILNPNGISNTNSKFKFEDFCRVVPGGIFTVIAVDGEEVLIRYSVSSKQKDEYCPSGVLFLEQKDTVNRIRWIYSKKKEKEMEEENIKQKKKQRIEQLLKNG